MKEKSGNVVTRAALRLAVQACCPGMSRADAKRTLDLFIEEISDALARGESVELRSFGSFHTRSKRARVGRNPKTRVEAPITARKVVRFKASPVLLARVNGEIIAQEED